MATDRNFSEMLNEYLTNDLLKEEMLKRSWILKNVELDDNWKGGDLIVPFRGASASTVKLGGLAAANAINQSKFVRGSITEQPELWGSLIFNERDLMEHDKISEQNFLKVLPDEIDEFMDYMKGAFSISVLSGHILAKAVGDGQAGGTIVVDRIERFELGQPVQLEDDNTAAAKYWVKAIDINTDTITLTNNVDWENTAASNISAYTVAQNARFYFDGAETAGNRFSAIKSMLLSAANGGGSTLYGKTKLAYPYLQAINFAGSTITAVNVLDKVFDFVTRMQNVAKGKANKIVMSYKHWGSILKLLEVEKGSYRKVGDMKTDQYGWSELDVGSVTGRTLTVVAVQEMDDDVIFLLDMSAFKVHSNGFFKKRKAPDGKEYFEVRNTTGYQYIVDACFFGDLVLNRPSRCGIIYGISY